MHKVLIAEDDKFLANAYKVRLIKEEFEVQVASDGEEVLNILKTFTPDVILLDLMMPKKDGFSVLEFIRSDPTYKHLPVIIASNLGQKEDLGKGMGLGANDFIVKSDMSLSDLVTKINKLIH